MLEHLELERSQAMLLLHNSLIERQVITATIYVSLSLSVCLSGCQQNQVFMNDFNDVSRSGSFETERK